MTDEGNSHLVTIDLDTVITIHDDVLLNTGGLPGFSGDISLEGALNRIDNHIYYEELSDPIDIAAWYGFAIARAHAFMMVINAPH